MNQFELTADGYEEAVKWLRVNGHESSLDTDRCPMDCYTIVTMANQLKNTPVAQIQNFLRPVLQAC